MSHRMTKQLYINKYGIRKPIEVIKISKKHVWFESDGIRIRYDYLRFERDFIPLENKPILVGFNTNNFMK